MESSNKTNILFDCDIGYIRKVEFKKENKIIKARLYSIRIARIFDQVSNIKNHKNLSLIKRLFNVQRLNDIIHSITGLYSLSLPEIGERAIYECLSSKKAFTICIIKDNDNSNQNELEDIESYSSDDCLSTIEESMHQNPNIFENVFSDESNEEDEQDESEDELKSFTKGLKSFIENSMSKKSSFVKNLLACATLERVNSYQLPGQDESIIDLQLLAVRNKYRGYSIGKYLINLILNKDFVGNYDAIVTCSDSNAIKFYEKFSFSIDPILNSKYFNIGDIWTDATKMCFIPPYASTSETKFNFKTLIKNIESDTDLESIFVNDEIKNEDVLQECDKDYSLFITELTNMERDFKKWQKLMFSSYQFQSKLFHKFKQEILNLKANICAKDSIIEELKNKNNHLLESNKLLQIKIDDLETKQEILVLNSKLKSL